MSAAVAFSYRYAHASGLNSAPRPGVDWGLSLATCSVVEGVPSNPYFLQGRLTKPKVTADLLLCLSDVVRARFYDPTRRLTMDPVVTSSSELLRFEGFSSDNGLYARVDVDAIEADIQGRGTTNVDFNAPMRVALSKVRDRDTVDLAVGAAEVKMGVAGSDDVVEKKVKLPSRWVRGFTEVQAYQAGMKPLFEVSGVEARRFIRSLPRSGANARPAFVVGAGRGLRLSLREARDSVRIAGTDRLRLLEAIITKADSLRVFAGASGTSAWELTTPVGRYTFMLSPEVHRDFSGEGQALDALAGDGWERALPRVKASLQWQSALDVDAIADRSGLERSEVEGALAVLAAQGQVGYDLHLGT
ncbi:MAG: SWIM zinc finger family protein [Proteobacteria bacterium]|nr:SWIM zinc finger family protein [Pseudomonadota bacterium]